MSESAGYYLNDDICSIKGIGSKKKEQLSAAGIETVGDLLDYYPVKYKDRRNIVRAMDARTDRDSLVCGKLIKVQLRPISGGRTITECTLRDDSCVFYAAFFNMPYLRKSIYTGEDYVLFGRMRLRNGARVWTNPEFSKTGGERDVRGILPVYRHSAGLTDNNLRKWIGDALENTELESDWIGSDITEERNLCSRGYAYRNIHFPESEHHYKAARYRLIYEKLLAYQLAIRINSAGLEESSADASVPEISMDPFYAGLPFELTEGQSKCVSEIMNDLSARRPMNRLVQGDVGCGKTAVAEAAMYRCGQRQDRCAYRHARSYPEGCRLQRSCSCHHGRAAPLRSRAEKDLREERKSGECLRNECDTYSANFGGNGVRRHGLQYNQVDAEEQKKDNHACTRSFHKRARIHRHGT